ncbi:hypothetical protein [Lactobacillus iners]|uniref:hypothetical protein n=1 Tax=Lactobacillus iners TaxID=147802 RepID=UPI003EBE3BF2|nr:class IIc cyclic bacteriocin [Lactobacillus iners]
MELKSYNSLTSKLFLTTLVLVGSFALLSTIFQTGNIMTILSACGLHVSKGLAVALSSIGSVYGVQQFLIAALGVTVPLWAAGAVAATGVAGA